MLQNALNQLLEVLPMIACIWSSCLSREGSHIPASLWLARATGPELILTKTQGSLIYFLWGEKSWIWLNFILNFTYILERLTSTYPDLLFSPGQIWGIGNFHKDLSLQTSLTSIFNLSVAFPSPVRGHWAQQLLPVDPKTMGQHLSSWNVLLQNLKVLSKHKGLFQNGTATVITGLSRHFRKI